MHEFLFAGIAAAAASLAFVANDTTIHPMAEASTEGAYINTVENWGQGYQFTATVPGIRVTELGYVTPGEGDYELALWDVATKTRLARIIDLDGTESSTDWEFRAIDAVSLVVGASYRVTLYGIGTAKYHFSDDDDYKPTGAIEYVATGYCNDCESDEYPSRTLAGYNYGFADIGYELGPAALQQPGSGGGPSSVPLPAALPMAAAAIAALALVARRRRDG